LVQQNIISKEFDSFFFIFNYNWKYFIYKVHTVTYRTYYWH